MFKPIFRLNPHLRRLIAKNHLDYFHSWISSITITIAPVEESKDVSKIPVPTVSVKFKFRSSRIDEIIDDAHEFGMALVECLPHEKARKGLVDISNLDHELLRTGVRVLEDLKVTDEILEAFAKRLDLSNRFKKNRNEHPKGPSHPTFFDDEKNLDLFYQRLSWDGTTVAVSNNEGAIKIIFDNLDLFRLRDCTENKAFMFWTILSDDNRDKIMKQEGLSFGDLLVQDVRYDLVKKIFDLMSDQWKGLVMDNMDAFLQQRKHWSIDLESKSELKFCDGRPVTKDTLDEIDSTDPNLFECDFPAMKEKMTAFRDELLEKVMNPERVERLLQMAGKERSFENDCLETKNRFEGI